MELWFNQASPFARKVRILAREKGLLSSITERPTIVSPVDTNEELAQRNPLVKIPMLVLDSGETLYDSRVICEYLDSLHDGDKALPAAGAQRFAALRRQALADGICDAAVLCRYEQAVRPESLRWPAWVDGQMRKVQGALEALEVDAGHWSGAFDLGHMATVSALGYLDFRFGAFNWRALNPKLADWYVLTLRRASVAATAISNA